MSPLFFRRDKLSIFFLYYRSGSTLFEAVLGKPWRIEQALGRDPYPVYEEYRRTGKKHFLPTLPPDTCPVDDAPPDFLSPKFRAPAPVYSWTIHIGDWWGRVSGDAVPGPYDVQTLQRWGPGELSRFPRGSRFVSLVRDGRDQIESLRRLKGGVEEEFQKADARDYFKVLCKGFRNRARMIIDCRKKIKGYRMFRYEDFRVDPVGTAAEMLRFLGHEPNLALMRENLARADANAGRDHSSFAGKGEGPRWLSWTADERRFFEETAGAELRELGYAQGANW